MIFGLRDFDQTFGFAVERGEKRLGQRIVKMHYMSKRDAEELGWYKRPLMLMLENGTWIIPQCDDEGNDGGAMWLMNNDRELKETLAPVITIADD